MTKRLCCFEPNSFTTTSTDMLSLKCAINTRNLLKLLYLYSQLCYIAVSLVESSVCYSLGQTGSTPTET